MTTRLGRRVRKLGQVRSVTRRAAVVWTGGRDTLGATVVGQVNLAIQRVADRPIQLERESDGDQTGGRIQVWVETEDLAAAFVVDPMIPLGWTELQTAPPERTEGPPGDLIEFEGRRYEITERVGWDETKTFTGPIAGFQEYEASERGASP